MNKYAVVITALVGAALVWAMGDSANITAGARLYSDNCQTCHGLGAVGISGVGPALKGEVANWNFTAFKRAVLRGIDDKGKPLSTVMPRWSLHGWKSAVSRMPTDAQLADLQAYLKSLK